MLLLSFRVIKLCIATTIIVMPRLMREVRGRATRYIDIAIYSLAMELLTSSLSAASARPGRYLARRVSSGIR